MAKVLVVDDDTPLREMLASTVEMFGYEAAQAGSIQEALEELKQGPIDLVMLDVKLPDADRHLGLERIRVVYPQLKVIMVTGYKSVETAAEAAKLGASGYIVKPFKAEEILETVKKNLK